MSIPWPPPDTEQQHHLLAGLRNGEWLGAQRFPALTYAVPGIVPEGSTLLVGPPKIGKSFLVLDIALAAAAGASALGAITVEQRPVLYLALEDGHRRLQERCAMLLGDDHPIPAALDYMITVQPGCVVATIAEWMTRHARAEPLIILDTLGKVMPPSQPGESAYQRDYRIGSALKRLVDDDPGASLLVNHHDRKAESTDFVDSVSGTHGLAGSADTIITLTRPRQEADGVLRVTGRDVTEGEYAVKFTAGSWTLNGSSLDDAAEAAAKVRASAGLVARTAEIVEFVAKHPDGARSKDVEDALGRDARRYLSRLVTSGRLARLGRGLYGLPPTTVSQVSQCPKLDDDEWDNGTVGTPLQEGTTS